MAQIYRQNGSIYDASNNQKIPDVATLQKNYAGATEIKAPTIPFGATKISGPSGLQGLKESDIYRSGADIYKLPSSVSSDVFNTPSATIKPVTPDPTSVDAMMAGVKTGNEGILAQLQARNATLQEQTNLNAIQKRQADYTEANKTAQTDLLNQKLNQYGTDANVAQVQKLMPQIASTTAAFDNYSVGLEGRTASASSIYGRQALAQRQKAVELAGLSAVAQAYQGNVDMARTMAQDAVNTQYEDQTNYINGLNTQLETAYTDLTAAEKKRADSLMLVNEERLRNIEEEKNNKTAINNIALDLAQAGADSATVSQIIKSGDISKAIELAAKSGLFIPKDNLQPTKIGQDSEGNDLFYDPVTKLTKTAAQLMKSELGEKGLVSPSGNAYDMSTYATDPKHAQSVQNKINEIGKFNSVQDIDVYIKSKYPNSQITGDMIAKASAQYGIGWEELTALIQHESLMGTSNVAKSNNNLGGITWNANFPASMKGTARPSGEGGNYVKFATLQDGVNSTAYELSKRKVDLIDEEQVTPVNTIAVNWAENIRDGKAKLSDITSEVEKSNPGLKSEVNSILKSLPPSERQINEAKDFVKKLKELKDNSGLKYAVGPTAVSRGGIFGIQGLGGAKDDFLGKAQTLISKNALGSLIEAKSQGATFGALSDAELALLKSSGTTLSAWANEKNGKVTGFDISESKFKEELNSMITEYEKIIAQANGGQGSVSMSEDEAYKLYQQIVNK